MGKKLWIFVIHENMKLNTPRIFYIYGIQRMQEIQSVFNEVHNKILMQWLKTDAGGGHVGNKALINGVR